MAFWLGIMKIAENCGLIDIIAKIIKPVTKRLFSEIPENSPALGDIAMNFSANALGLTNAATPIGIKAMEELQLEPKLDYYKEMRKGFMWAAPHIKAENPRANIETGKRVMYAADVKTDNRSAFGAALLDLVKLNKAEGQTDIIVFDCDLAGSVKTNGVEKNYPENFFQSGIAEHHTAVCAGAASVNGVISFFADFGMFGVDEVYNQHRLNEINSSNLKVVTTHVGVDVGEDGKTHMCVDYIGLLRNIFGYLSKNKYNCSDNDLSVFF